MPPGAVLKHHFDRGIVYMNSHFENSAICNVLNIDMLNMYFANKSIIARHTIAMLIHKLLE